MMLFNKSMTGLSPKACENLPIPFVSKARKTDNPDENLNKTVYIKLEFYLTLETFLPSLASKNEINFIIFKYGCAEDWVK